MSSKLKIATAILVLLVIASQVRHQPALGRAEQGMAEKKSPPNDAVQNLKAYGEVPGNPTAEVAQLHKLAQALSTYRKLHEGAYPPSGTDLLKDILGNMPAYGFHSFQQVLSLCHNPDAKFADDPEARAYPQSYQAFTLPQTRPDGSSKGQSKPLGTQDVEAYTNLYYHQNIKHGAEDRTTSHPAGFYLVLWASGQVEAIPYSKVYYVPDRPGDYVLAFPGEAGVPKDALTYQQLYPKS